MTWTDRFCEHLVMVTGRCSAAAGEVAMSIADRDNYNLKLGSVLPGRSTDAAVLIATHDPEVAAEADGHAVLDEGRLSWDRPLYWAPANPERYLGVHFCPPGLR
jgi:hypothetical protein